MSALTFLLILSNAAIADVLLWFLARSGRVVSPGTAPTRPPILAAGLALALLLPAASTIWGAARLRAVDAATRPGPGVLLVQGNIPQHIKNDESNKWDNLAKHVRMTRGALGPSVDLVIWPETTASIHPEAIGPEADWVRDTVRSLGTPLVLGALGLTRIDGELRFANSAFLVDRDGSIVARYDKQVLVPLGEYVPVLGRFRSFRESLGKKLSQTYGFYPFFLAGDEATLLPLAHEGRALRLAPLICYEDVLPPLVREFARKGADVFVNISNEDWYYLREMDQHLDMAIFRAVETRRPMVRATNTGLTAVIDAGGRIRERVPGRDGGKRVDATVFARVPLCDLRPPLLAQALFGWTCGAAALAIAAFAARTGRRR